MLSIEDFNLIARWYMKRTFGYFSSLKFHQMPFSNFSDLMRRLNKSARLQLHGVCEHAMNTPSSGKKEAVRTNI